MEGGERLVCLFVSLSNKDEIDYDVHVVVQGLRHLHDHRLCHLDIKPANIFLGMDGVTCKLGDFGLCMSLDQGMGEAVEGDARYLAPEVMKHHFGQYADVFR